jgi:hypothetical protein
MAFLCVFAFTAIVAIGFGQQSSLLKAADRTVETQNNDGGWDWENPNLNPDEISPFNTLGVTAQCALDQYKLAGGSGYLTTCTNAHNGMVTRSGSPDPSTHKMRGPDIQFLVELSEATGTSTYADFAKTRWNSAKEEFGLGSAKGFGQYIVGVRAGIPAIISWDINLYVQSMLALNRYYPGQNYNLQADTLAEVIYTSMFVAPKDFDTTNTALTEYWLGFTGAIDAFASTGLHNAEKTALVNGLLASQQADGHFVGVGDGSNVQTTAYATLSLIKAGGNITAVTNAMNYLVVSQQLNGGWLDNSGVENSEITSEAGHAMSKYVDAGLPVEIISFTATVERNGPVLQWKTATEVNNHGFEVERKVVGAQWSKIGFVSGNGTTNSSHDYSFTDRSFSTGQNVYRLKQVDRDGKYEYSREVEVSIAAPKAFMLNQGYPNPFNPSTKIQFTLEKDGWATLKAYNVIGQKVAILFEGNAEAERTYDITFKADNLPSGTYIVRLESAGQVKMQKLVLMK